MGAVGINPYNESLMNKYNYTNKRDLKQLFRNYDNLYELAKQGDTVALSIHMDLELAYEMCVLTERQRTCLVEHLIYKEPLRDVAEALEISHEAVRNNVNGAIKRIQQFLLAGGMLV